MKKESSKNHWQCKIQVETTDSDEVVNLTISHLKKLRDDIRSQIEQLPINANTTLRQLDNSTLNKNQQTIAKLRNLITNYVSSIQFVYRWSTERAGKNNQVAANTIALEKLGDLPNTKSELLKQLTLGWRIPHEILINHFEL